MHVGSLTNKRNSKCQHLEVTSEDVYNTQPLLCSSGFSLVNQTVFRERACASEFSLPLPLSLVYHPRTSHAHTARCHAHKQICQDTIRPLQLLWLHYLFWRVSWFPCMSNSLLLTCVIGCCWCVLKGFLLSQAYKSIRLRFLETFTHSAWSTGILGPGPSHQPILLRLQLKCIVFHYHNSSLFAL